MIWIPDSIQTRLVLVLAHFLWQGTLIAALLASGIALLRVRRAKVRYATSLCGFVLMAVSPVVTWFVLPEAESAAWPSVREATQVRPAWPEIVSAPQIEVRDRALMTEAWSPPAMIALDQLVETTPPPVLAHGVEFESKPELIPPPRSGEASPTESVATAGAAWWRWVEPWIVFTWLCGVILFSLRLMIAAGATWRWRAQVEPLPGSLVTLVDQLCGLLGMRVPRVGLSHRVTEAVAMGLFRPLILLPVAWAASLPPDMIEAVLAHELAHIRRYDLWVNLMQRVVETLLFYHPAVWWLSGRLRQERELCCDELAVATTRDDVRYAETLEHIGRMSLASTRHTLAVSMGGPKHALLERVRHVLKLGSPDDSRGGSLAAAIVLAVTILSSIAVSMTMLTAADEPLPSVPQTVLNQHSPIPAVDHLPLSVNGVQTDEITGEQSRLSAKDAEAQTTAPASKRADFLEKIVVISADKIPLSELLADITTQAALKLSYDRPTIQKSGINLEARITFNSAELVDAIQREAGSPQLSAGAKLILARQDDAMTCRAALTLLLEPLGLNFRLEGDTVHVSEWVEIRRIEKVAARGGKPPKPWRVSGRVSGIPHSVRVMARAGRESSVVIDEAWTDRDGKYELDFAPTTDSGLELATITVQSFGRFERNAPRVNRLLIAHEKVEQLVGWEGLTKADLILPNQPRVIDFEMVPAAMLSGTLKDERGNLLHGFTVSVVNAVDPNPCSVAVAVTDNHGRFQLQNLPTWGVYQLLIEPVQQAAPWNAWATGPMTPLADDKRNDFHARHGDTELIATQLTLVLKSAGIFWKDAMKSATVAAPNEVYGVSEKTPTVLRAGSMELQLSPPGAPQEQGRFAVPGNFDGMPKSVLSPPVSSSRTERSTGERSPSPVAPKHEHAVSVRGRVLIDGAIPDVPPLKVKVGLMLVNPRNDEDERKNAEREKAAVAVEIPDDSLVISKDGGLANVAIYLKKAPAGWKPTDPPSEPIELRAADHRFQPRMSLLRVGQSLRLNNMKHEAQDFRSAPIRSNLFHLMVDRDLPRLIDKPFTISETLPTEVKSNIHGWQKAYLLALDHPFAAITDADGRFEIRDLTAGEHHFTVWHERCGYLNKDLVVRVEHDKVAEVELKYPAEQLERRVRP